jgi:hypothetical membrane protein
MRFAAAACWTVAGIGYLVLEAFAANGFRSDYGYAANLISDLGRPDLNTSAPLMNAAFYLQGTLYLAAAILVSRDQRAGRTTPFVAFATANALGNIVVATVHGSSWLHIAGAVLAIVGGNAAALAGSAVLQRAGAPRSYRTLSVGLGALGLVAFATLAAQTLGTTVIVAPDAVLERVSVYTIIAWQLFSAAIYGTLSPWQPRTRGARITPRF